MIRKCQKDTEQQAKKLTEKALKFGNYFVTLSASMYSSWTLL